MRDRHRAPRSTERWYGSRPVELVFAVDDEDAPAEVTAFPRRGHGDTTAWITIDVEHVVDLIEHA